MTLTDVLNSGEYKRILGEYIRSYIRSPKGGFKRLPQDRLIEMDLFSVETLTEEFYRIDTGISDLPNILRRTVGAIVISAAKKAHRILEPEAYKEGE